MNNFFEKERRLAVGFLNYEKPLSQYFDPRKPLGPNTMGELLYPVSISDDRKRLGLSYIAPAD